MDSFHVHLKLNNLKRLGNVFRVIEFCVFVIAVSRVSSQFQFQFPVGEYVKRILSIILSHRSVFVIGNVIVITLFAKSGKDSNSHPDQNLKSDTPPNQSYNELIEKSSSATTPNETHGGVIEAVQTGTERETRSIPNIAERNQSAWFIKQNVHEDKLVKPCFKRSYSECLEVENYIKPRRILRRTVTDGSTGAASRDRCGEMETLEGYGDGMSDEEFRVMVERFIAKQQKSLREEEKCSSYF